MRDLLPQTAETPLHPPRTPGPGDDRVESSQAPSGPWGLTSKWACFSASGRVAGPVSAGQGWRYQVISELGIRKAFAARNGMANTGFKR